MLDWSDGAEAAIAGSEVVTVSDRVMAKLATTQHPRGPVAVVRTPKLANRPDSSALVLWGIGDPGNVGTALRSCAAFGISTVVGPGCADLWNPKVLRAAAGAHFRGTVVVAPDLTVAQLHTWGLDAVAAVPKGGSRPVFNEQSRVAVLIGGEGSGLELEVVAECDSTVTLPMPGGVESLNAGVTASLFAYELSRPLRPA